MRRLPISRALKCPGSHGGGTTCLTGACAHLMSSCEAATATFGPLFRPRQISTSYPNRVKNFQQLLHSSHFPESQADSKPAIRHGNQFLGSWHRGCVSPLVIAIALGGSHGE